MWTKPPRGSKAQKTIALHQNTHRKTWVTAVFGRQFIRIFMRFSLWDIFKFEIGCTEGQNWLETLHLFLSLYIHHPCEMNGHEFVFSTSTRWHAVSSNPKLTPLPLGIGRPLMFVDFVCRHHLKSRGLWIQWSTVFEVQKCLHLRAVAWTRRISSLGTRLCSSPKACRETPWRLSFRNARAAVWGGTWTLSPGNRHDREPVRVSRVTVRSWDLAP